MQGSCVVEVENFGEFMGTFSGEKLVLRREMSGRAEEGACCFFFFRRLLSCLCEVRHSKTQNSLCADASA